MFGDVVDGEMVLNDIGEFVNIEWVKTQIIRSNVFLDEFVIMPNHLHGIIFIDNDVGATRRVVPSLNIKHLRIESINLTKATHRVAPTSGLQSNSIGAIIGQFKSIVTKRINAYRNTPTQYVWQRNYYEHIIRDEDDLNRIREYIFNNPSNWDIDTNNVVELAKKEQEDIIQKTESNLKGELEFRGK